MESRHKITTGEMDGIGLRPSTPAVCGELHYEDGCEVSHAHSSGICLFLFCPVTSHTVNTLKGQHDDKE